MTEDEQDEEFKLNEGGEQQGNILLESTRGWGREGKGREKGGGNPPAHLQ